jgi:hypothetical protein
MQWTTVRLVVSENDGRRHDRKKTTGGRKRILRFARGDETMYSSIRAKMLSRTNLSCPLLGATLGVRA